MATGIDEVERVPNGEALAAFLAAGIGVCAMGMFVIANEAGIFAAPALYGPAGGLSGRSTFAIIVWLIAWGLLHARWRGRNLATGRIFVGALLLVTVGVIAAFPPLWALL